MPHDKNKDHWETYKITEMGGLGDYVDTYDTEDTLYHAIANQTEARYLVHFGFDGSMLERRSWPKQLHPIVIAKEIAEKNAGVGGYWHGRYREIERQLERAEQCSTCGGTVHPSGKVCVCGGSGLSVDEVCGLRKAAMEAEANAEAAEEVADTRRSRIKILENRITDLEIELAATLEIANARLNGDGHGI